MLMTIVDGNGSQQIIVVASQGATTDVSGHIATSNVFQLVSDASPGRSGILIQNTGTNPMRIDEQGTQTAATAFLLAPGAYWPPAGYPVPTAAVFISGVAADAYVARTW